MKQVEIGKALKDRLAAMNFTPPVPVIWPNRDAQPNADRFLSVVMVRAENQRLTLRSHHRFSGSLVVTVASRSGNGSAEGEGIADAVAAHFPADLRLPMSDATLRITATPSIREGFVDAGYWRTPLTIPFEVMA